MDCESDQKCQTRCQDRLQTGNKTLPIVKEKNTTKEIIISIVSFLNGCYRELCYYSAKTVKSFSDERIILY